MLNSFETWPIQENGIVDPAIQNAFTSGSAQKVLLPLDFELCKLNNNDQLTRGTDTKVSPWWSPYEEYEWDGGFENRIKMASHFGVSIRELSRIFVAVSENWNSFEYLLIARLKEPVHAFFGKVAGQSRMAPAAPGAAEPKKSRALAGEGSSKSKGLAGNAGQFYIPNLTTAHIRLISARSLASF